MEIVHRPHYSHIHQSQIREEWLPVVGWEGYYEVSSLGRVRSARSGQSTYIGRILKPFHGKDRTSVKLSKAPDRPKNQKVHFLVCRAFHGEPPTPKHEVAHWDGDHKNNRATNLRWATRLENIADSRRLGVLVRGSRVGNSKLTEADVLRIRELLKEGMRRPLIAKIFGVSYDNIHAIAVGDYWAWLK